MLVQAGRVEEVVFFAHISQNGRHRGEKATLTAVADSYLSPQMRLLVSAYVITCTCCFKTGNSEVGNRELRDWETAAPVNIHFHVTTASQTTVAASETLASIMSVGELPLQYVPVFMVRSGMFPTNVLKVLKAVSPAPRGVVTPAGSKYQYAEKRCGEPPRFVTAGVLMPTVSQQRPLAVSV